MRDIPSVGAENVVRGELFFIGVESKTALKKRYKQLLKIYHPDNLCGDTETLQEINRVYHRLYIMQMLIYHFVLLSLSHTALTVCDIHDSGKQELHRGK